RPAPRAVGLGGERQPCEGAASPACSFRGSPHENFVPPEKKTRCLIPCAHEGQTGALGSMARGGAHRRQRGQRARAAGAKEKRRASPLACLFVLRASGDS